MQTLQLQSLFCPGKPVLPVECYTSSDKTAAHLRAQTVKGHCNTGVSPPKRRLLGAGCD